MISSVDVASFLNANKRGMPLPEEDTLDQYICEANFAKTIRVYLGPGGIEGVMMWKQHPAGSLDSDIWDDTDPEGDVIAVHHLVCTTKRALSAMARYLLSKGKKVWGERRGQPKEFTTKLLTQLAEE